MIETVERYLEAWNETDPAARRALVEQIWAADATYCDPMAQARGWVEIDALIAAVQNQFPGLVFSLIGDVDAHHSQARFQWGLGPDGAEPVVVGFDVAVVDEDGRLADVLGFLDKVPG